MTAALTPVPDYHLLCLTTGISHGGWVSLDAARAAAHALGLQAWQIWNGNVRVENHDTDHGAES